VRFWNDTAGENREDIGVTAVRRSHTALVENTLSVSARPSTREDRGGYVISQLQNSITRMVYIEVIHCARRTADPVGYCEVY